MRVTVKVECSCKTRYKFEVEPLDGKMPIPVQCPTCGADGTEYANWVLARELEKGPSAAESPAAAPAKIEVPKPFVSKPKVSNTGQGEAVVPRHVRDTAMAEHCFKHVDQAVAGFCFVCKKPVCLICMKKFGYFCSTACRHMAEERNMNFPQYPGQESFIREKKQKAIQRMTAVLVVLAAMVCGLWIWYAWFGSRPSVAYSVKIPAGDEVIYCKFVDPGHALLITEEKMTLYDVASKKEQWSRPLASYRTEINPASHRVNIDSLDDDDWDGGAFAAAGPVAGISGDHLWVSFFNSVVGFDLETGEEWKKVPIEGRLLRVRAGPSSILAVSQGAGGGRLFTRIETGTGEVQTATAAKPPPVHAAEEPPAPVQAELPGDPLEAALTAHAGALTLDESGLRGFHEAWVPAQSDVTHVRVKLEKAKIATYQAMKPPEPEKPATGEQKPMSVLDTADFAQEVMEEWSRNLGGDVREEDESTYAVDLTDVFSKSGSEWSGKVTGPPGFFPLDTVKVLISGKEVRVFDSGNKLLWEAKLTYPVQKGHGFVLGEGRQPAPCLEHGDSLYVFDRGILTAFALKTGEVRWRLTSVGISKVQVDRDGMLYANTTTASPDYIEYPNQVNVTERVNPLLIKVDPGSGKVLWKQEQTSQEGEFHLSDKYLYMVTASVSRWDMLGSVWKKGDIPTHFRIYRLDPGNGKRMWEHYQTRGPISVDFAGNRILLLYPDELEVLKYLSF